MSYGQGWEVVIRCPHCNGGVIKDRVVSGWLLCEVCRGQRYIPERMYQRLLSRLKKETSALAV